MNNAKSTIHGGLYDFLREAKKRTLPSEFVQEDNKFARLSTMPSSKTSSTSHQHSKCPNYNNESYQKIAPIIPKNFSFVIKAATFSAVKENSQNDFSAKMHLFSVSIIAATYIRVYVFWENYFKLKFPFQITGEFNSKSLNENVQLPTVFTKLVLQHLDIDTKYEKLLFIEQFTIDSMVSIIFLHTVSI